MTYVSRRTRIIVSRWSDECDAEYILRACRKRSDGRLKKHNSCDDLRAWVNDNCVKHEHLVDLMSNGEFLGKPPFRLFGRFIPVPILFKLAQSANISKYQSNKNQQISTATDSNSRDEKTKRFSGKDPNLEDDSLTRLEWERTLLEKSLFDCTCILSKAMGKLEKINNIVTLACDETEIARMNEIQRAFTKAKVECTCTKKRSCSLSSSNTTSDNLSSSKSYLKKLNESVRCTDLWRKILNLKEKIKKIGDCRQEIVQQIRSSQQKAERRSSSLQVTELYSRREEAQVKRLQKKLEKLIVEKGRLLSEMSQALTCLNTREKMSKSNVLPWKNSRPYAITDGREERPPEAPVCHCGCKFSDNYETTDSEKIQCSESSSMDSVLNKCFEKLKESSRSCRSNHHFNYMECVESNADGNNLSSEPRCGDTGSPKPKKTSTTYSKLLRNSKAKQNRLLPQPKKFEKGKLKSIKSIQKESVSKESSQKSPRTSKVKSFFKDPPCRRVLNSDDLSAFEKALTPEQQAVILGALEHIRSIDTPRPSTTPITKREKETADREQSRNSSGQNSEGFQEIPERKVKSETTMKEIEKALRNYEQRLVNLNSLECKIEELIQKSIEACVLKQKLAKIKADVKEQRAADREKSNREITRLCSENWELKKQVLQLTAEFEAQSQKIQTLKCRVMKTRELECEAEELKKELSEYRDGFEHQRKCISKWESVVAMQRTEIENLMNHIRKLTTMKEETEFGPYQEKRCIQRSRSYSPEKNREKISNTRPKTQTRPCRGSSEEEEMSQCCCKDYRQPEIKRKIQQRLERGYCSPSRGSMGWCS